MCRRGKKYVQNIGSESRKGAVWGKINSDGKKMNSVIQRYSVRVCPGFNRLRIKDSSAFL
jgi:hypothetical protein